MSAGIFSAPTFLKLEHALNIELVLVTVVKFSAGISFISLQPLNIKAVVETLVTFNCGIYAKIPWPDKKFVILIEAIVDEKLKFGIVYSEPPGVSVVIRQSNI
jgi:hypothetical protein